MTVSVNTAMSLASGLSDDTNTVELAIPAAVGGASPTWAEVASDVSQPTNNNVRTSPQGSNRTDADLTSALSSSQAEVNTLRDQVAELKAEREKTAQLIAEAVKQQVAEALAAQIPPPAREDHVTSQQFTLFLQAQDRKFDVLTTMFAHMLSTQPGHENHATRPAATLLRYQDDSVQNAQILGKRTAQDDIDSRIDTDLMETDEFETTRKRLDSRQTPERGSNQTPNTDQDVPDLVPRRLMSDSPCTVPLPDSPPDIGHPLSPSSPEPVAAENSETSTQTLKAHPAQFQQQSMSRYLRIDPTGTSIQQDTPPLSRPLSGELADDSRASLSVAEDASPQLGSGNESKNQIQQSSHDGRESPNQKS